MKRKEEKLIEIAVEKVANALGEGIIKEPVWTWNPFKDKYRYFDKFNREYKPHLNEREKSVVVKVAPARVEKTLNLKEEIKEFVVKDGKVYRITDREIVLKFISEFLQERDYRIERIEIKKSKIHLRWNKAEIFVEGHKGEIEIVRNFPNWEVKLKDTNKNNPFFCTPGYQYIFKLKRMIEFEKAINLKDVLIEYQESEISTTSLSPFALLRRAIYGFKSSNLRAFYSEEGLFPEVKHAVKLAVLGNLSGAIVNASVFVRVAEKLKGNTWYTLAAGILSFIRAPAEVFYMRRSLKLTENLPSSTVQKVIDGGRFKRIYESKEIRSWRNFERVLFEIFKGKENLTFMVDKYIGVKPDIYSAIEENDKEKAIEILKGKLGITEKEMGKIRYFINNLMPIKREEIISHLIDEINKFVETKVLKPGSENILKKYLREIFSENLKRYTSNKSFKLLHDRIKQEERAPSKEEISNLVYECKRNILPFKIYNLFLFITLYAIGYGATFFPSMPDMTIMIYYIFYGASVNIIVAAMNRFGAQMSLQYLYRGLENAPTITSAADAWNEYNSHLMRLWAVFSSIGLIIGILGKVFSDRTGGFSRYFVEGIAFILFLQSFREWFLFYNKLEKRSEMEE